LSQRSSILVLFSADLYQNNRINKGKGFGSVVKYRFPLPRVGNYE